MIRLTFLGTAASRPTVARNVSSLAVQREGEFMLFDCGEGTQRQMMRYGTGFGIQSIFITHLHADHFLGVIGLLRTMGLQGREDPLSLFGPPGSRRVLEGAVHLGIERTQFPVHISELHAGECVKHDKYEIRCFGVAHGVNALGYALVEQERLGRFDPEQARALGVPEGPLFGHLHRGETVEVDGRAISPDDLVGPPRPGRKIVYTGDTRPTPSVVEVATGADVLVHEATFGEEEAERARQTLHSTVAEAADVARQAGVRRLVLTHISARYAENPKLLETEAKTIFAKKQVARDGLEIEVPYRDAPDGESS